MRCRRTCSRTRALLVAAVALVVATEAAGAQLQSFVATARIRSGNVTLTDDSVSGFTSNPQDSTGLVEANGADILPETPPVDSGAISEFDLPNGAIGMSAGFDATANGPDDTRIFDPYGGASATYFDDVTVTSSTLPNGTPVDVRFVYHLAFSADATSTLPSATASGDCTSTANGTQGIAPADNRYLSILDSATFIEAGLFVAPHTAEFTIPTTVGSTFSFALACDVSSFGSVFMTGPPGNPLNNTSSGWMSLGISFGGEVVGADAALVSGVLGGPFPAAGAVGVAAAEAALPANPYDVPEPGFGSMLALGGLLGASIAHGRAARARRRTR